MASTDPARAAAPLFSGPFLTPKAGTFAAPDYADIDGDGDLDAFVGNQVGEIVLFENAGTASAPRFTAPTTNPFGLADVGNYASPAFADLDGDGDFDAFVGNLAGDTLFFENTGSAAAPAFDGPSTNPFGLVNVAGLVPTGARAAPAFADLDGDGDLDAFVGVSGYSDPLPPAEPGPFGLVMLFENTGTAVAPAFAAPVVGPAVERTYGMNPAAGDIDDDGDLDLFVGVADGRTMFFENQGTPGPTFGAAAANPFGLSSLPGASPDLADIDGDGDLDALVGMYSGQTVWFRNTGTQSAPTFAAWGNPFGITNVAVDASPTLADVDGDGDLDAFVGEYFGETFLFENTGTALQPEFAAPSRSPLGLADVEAQSSPAFADIDGDGDLDAVLGVGFGNVAFFRNTGSARRASFVFVSDNPFGLVNVGTRAAPAFYDIDRDRDLDAFLGHWNGAPLFFENTGSRTAPIFAAPSSELFGQPSPVATLSSPAFADLDRDGDGDAFVGHLDGDVVFFENTGTATAPTFAAPSANPFGLANVVAVASPDFADLDADGDLDALVGSASGETTWFENLELGPGTCADGRDNDGDGASDHPADAGCIAAADPSEYATSECDNGRDDDHDGKVDWRDGGGDPECVSPSQPSEACAAMPAPDCAVEFTKGSLLVSERKPGYETLVARLQRGPALAQADFGPADGTRTALCVYDQAGALAGGVAVDGAGALCGDQPCWKPLGKPGLAYKDAGGAAGGVRSVELRGGSAGKSSIGVEASSPPKQEAPALASDMTAALVDATEVTLQLRTGDGCFETTLREVRSQTLRRFEAR